MKRTAVCLLIAALCLGLAGCAARPAPEKAADGAEWSEGWVTVGGVVGVDTPDGMTARENNEALAASGMYYATWSVGEGEPCANGDGEEATLYDAQAYLLLGGYKSGEEARDTMAQWREMAQAQYTVNETAEAVHNGQEFSLITYTFDGEANPYDRGTSAFGVYRNYAISVEFVCREGFGGDAGELLAQFLDSCHYAMP